MNKKAQSNFWTIVIIVSVVLVLLVGTIVVLILIGQGNSETPKELINLSVYVKAVDSEGQQIKANYIIIDNVTILSQGNLSSNSLTEAKIKVPKLSNTTTYCYSNGYYLSTGKDSSGTEKGFTQQETSQNSSRRTCTLQKADDITITHSGVIGKGVSNININISGENFENISGVIRWSTGIIDVDSGSVYFEDKPNRYSATDKAFTLNKSLNGTQKIQFQVKTIDEPRDTDCVTFIFMDKDKRFNGEWGYYSELNGNNLGNEKDFPYEICYNG